MRRPDVMADHHHDVHNPPPGFSHHAPDPLLGMNPAHMDITDAEMDDFVIYEDDDQALSPPPVAYSSPRATMKTPT